MRKGKHKLVWHKPVTPNTDLQKAMELCTVELAKAETHQRLLMLAQIAFAEYKAYIAAGFDPSQAMYLTGLKNAK